MRLKIIFIGILVLAVFLRFYQLNSVPRGFHYDEASIIYNAYAISDWHRDEFGTFMPLSFRSFGDYKPPFLIYLLSFPYLFTGLDVNLLRLISATSGIILCITSYFIARELLSLWPDSPLLLKRLFPPLSFLGMAISPWAIHFSRLGYEQNLTTTLIYLGVLFFLLGNKKPLYYLISAIPFSLSLYTFHTAKITTPLLILSLVLIFFHSIKIHLKYALIAFSIFAISLLPLVYSAFTTASLARASNLIIFNATGHLAEFSSIIQELAKNIINQFGLGFWLFGNDAVSIRHIVPGIGVIYPHVFIFLITGFICFLLFTPKNIRYLLLSFFILGFLPALISKNTPHTLRAFSAVVPTEIISAFGFVYALHFIKKSAWLNKALLATYLALSIIFLYKYQTTYYQEYAIDSATEFQYGYEHVFSYLRENHTNEKIVITDSYGQPYIYALIYNHIKPQQFLFGALSLYQFKPIKWPETQKNTFYIGTPQEIPTNDPSVIKLINIPQSDKTALVIAKT